LLGEDLDGDGLGTPASAVDVEVVTDADFFFAVNFIADGEMQWSVSQGFGMTIRLTE